MLDIIEGRVCLIPIMGLISESHLQRQYSGCFKHACYSYIFHDSEHIGNSKIPKPQLPSAFDLVSSICHKQMEASRKRNLSDTVHRDQSFRYKASVGK